jgi:hypothetical protein
MRPTNHENYRYRIRFAVVVAPSRWVSHVEPGMVFETAAFV